MLYSKARRMSGRKTKMVTFSDVSTKSMSTPGNGRTSKVLAVFTFGRRKVQRNFTLIKQVPLNATHLRVVFSINRQQIRHICVSSQQWAKELWKLCKWEPQDP
jgi:hypothetical protein